MLVPKLSGCGLVMQYASQIAVIKSQSQKIFIGQAVGRSIHNEHVVHLLAASHVHTSLLFPVAGKKHGQQH